MMTSQQIQDGVGTFCPISAANCRISLKFDFEDGHVTKKIKIFQIQHGGQMLY